MYDHVDDPTLLRDYWPIATRGAAIITTQNMQLKHEFHSVELEIKPWNEERGADYLLHLLPKQTAGYDQKWERALALFLSRRLGGHALKITAFASTILEQRLSIMQFVELHIRKSVLLFIKTSGRLDEKHSGCVNEKFSGCVDEKYSGCVDEKHILVILNPGLISPKNPRNIFSDLLLATSIILR